jgi:hypothetical protein
MIDFVSTREGVSPETQRAAQMLAHLIAVRIRDAATQPTFLEIDARQNYDGPALMAIDYFFRTDSAFEDHIEMLGGSAAAMRAALLSDRPLAQGSGFSLEQRERIQARHAWWKAARPQLKEAK